MNQRIPPSAPDKSRATRARNPFRERKANKNHDEYFIPTNDRHKEGRRETGYSGRRPLTRIKSLNMKFAYFLSALMHCSAVLLWLLLPLLLLLLFHIHPHPKVKPVHRPDMEFVLLPPTVVERPPINPKTHFVAEKASRAGGQHDPTKAVSLQPKATPPVKPSPATPPPQPQIQPKVVVQQPTPPVPPKPEMVVTKPTEPLPKPTKAEKLPLPAIPTPDPAPAKAPPAPEKPAKSVEKPDPAPTPQPEVTQSASAAQTPPSPAMAPAPLPDWSELLNPGPGGNKSDAPGVDANKEPDFGPYMKELQRRIKTSWHPPRGNESKTIVVVFRVNRNGELIKYKISKPSGVAVADEAAIEAIHKTFPFRPLPPEYKKENIDIEFTFDYNVFGKKNTLGRP